jgi:diguanylate cyclase (GGDEF)-like protein
MSTNPKCSLLVVDDEPFILTTLSTLLAREFEVHVAPSAEAARDIFRCNRVDLILTDQKMPGASGVQLLEWVRKHSPQTIRLLMTGFAELEDAVQAINRGQVYRYLFKPWRADELLQVLRDAARTYQLERRNEQLVDELRRLNLGLEHRVQERTQELEEANRELKQKNSMLEKLALTDPLTCLPNRRAMDRLAEAEVRRRARYASWLTLGFIDADRFKDINSRYLLPGGDQVLVDLAKILSDSVRTVDTLGRMGGDEFIVVAPETTPDGALVLAERIRNSVADYRFAYNGETIQVTVSAGFVVVEPEFAADYDQLKHLAAAALEEAKAGRNRCVVFALPPHSAAKTVLAGSRLSTV